MLSDNPKDLRAVFRTEGVLGCPTCCQEISEGRSRNNKRIPRVLQQRKCQIILGLNKTKRRKKCCSPSPASLDSNHGSPPTVCFPVYLHIWLTLYIKNMILKDLCPHIIIYKPERRIYYMCLCLNDDW